MGIVCRELVVSENSRWLSVFIYEYGTQMSSFAVVKDGRMI
jgi:hypothetical protein